MPVDNYKFLPRLLAALYEAAPEKTWSSPPWTPLPAPVSSCKFGLVTTAGIYNAEKDQPFDLDTEREKPDWGDPSFRAIPVNLSTEHIGVSHLHINPRWIQEDINVALPIHRFQEFASEGIIGGLADYAYSFMGYQGFPSNTQAWEQEFAHQVAQRLLDESVHCVLLTPS
jgi:hypothetical protein